MAKIIDLFPSMDDDMRSYHKKIWSHRLGILLKYLGLLCMILLVIYGIFYYVKNKSYSDCSVVFSTEREDTITTKYAPFGGKILKYSRDGISYTDEKNSLFFSITYTMQEPLLALCDKAGAVANKNGNQIFVFDQKSSKGEIKTLLPIKQIDVSNQGIVAVLLEDAKVNKLEVYSPDGKLLGEGVFDLKDAGHPMNVSISSDGTKIAIAFAQISGAKLNSCVAVYNFDNVGENYVDHLVFAKSYTDYLVPELHYYDSETFSAVGDGILAFYQGNQIPELVKEVFFEEPIKSVFYGERQIGLVFEAESGYVLKLYDLKGNEVSQIPFDINYDNIRIENDLVLVYGSSEMGLYSHRGKECFRHTLDASLVDIFSTGSRNKYLFIYTNETQLISLH